MSEVKKSALRSPLMRNLVDKIQFVCSFWQSEEIKVQKKEETHQIENL